MYTHKMSYSHEPRYQTFGKDYEFFFLIKTWLKILAKNE